MGLGPRFSSYTSPPVPTAVVPRLSPLYTVKQEPIPKGNPQPQNFQILNLLQIGENALLHIKYPDADNYEGEKIIVYRNVSVVDIEEAAWIDPHFTDDKDATFRPFARFEPSGAGALAAYKCAAMI